uniref:Uncharacterized protein n=1 Tax=Megaselia scalaris TaxID=36166 RepID=T1GSF2_MEGSC
MKLDRNCGSVSEDRDSRKTRGGEGVPAKLLKGAGDTFNNVFHCLLSNILISERMLEEWNFQDCKGLSTRQLAIMQLFQYPPGNYHESVHLSVVKHDQQDKIHKARYWVMRTTPMS